MSLEYWRMCKQIRGFFKNNVYNLKGVGEIENFIEGKESNKHRDNRVQSSNRLFVIIL